MSNKFSPQIDRYESDAALLPAAIRGLSPADFRATPIPNTWSIAQITLHLMDSDLIASDRMKRIIAEDNPAIIGFDESAFAQKLFYEKVDPFLAADIFQKNRQPHRHHPPQPPRRRLHPHRHPQPRGPITLADMLQSYIDHLHHHLAFLKKKRALLGKPV